MIKVPKDMDEFVKVAKAVSVKIAGTISKLCESYVAKVGNETNTSEKKPAEVTPAHEEPPKKNN